MSEPVLHLWGRTTSLNVRKVIWCAQELGLTVQRTEAGGAHGRVREPAYLARNPNGLVPMIDDAGFVLWESNVIVRYLCARHASGTLYPDAPTRRFEAEQWMDWQQTTFNPAGRDAFVQLVRTPEAERDAARIAASVAATEPLLALLDAHLATRPWMAGDAFTMADIPIGCDVHRWFGLPQPRPTWVHVGRWFDALRARAGAVGVLDQALA